MTLQDVGHDSRLSTGTSGTQGLSGSVRTLTRPGCYIYDTENM